MTTKTKLIPFDWELYQQGMKAITRDRRIVLEVLKSDIEPAGFCYLALIEMEGHRYDYFRENGAYSSFGERQEDLMLEIPVEEKTFWINVNPESMASTLWETEEDADNYKSPRRLGKIKVTYTEEDLIK